MPAVTPPVIILKVLATVLWAALLVACGGPTESDSIASARANVAKGNYSNAVIELKSALQKNPGAAEARYLLGVALLEQGEFGAAVVELSKADDAGFDAERVHPKLARALLGTGRVKEVIDRFGKTTLSRAQDHSELRTAVAVAYARRNQQAEATVAVSEALEADPRSAWALLTRARIFAAEGKHEQAMSIADRAAAGGALAGEFHLLKGAIQRAILRDSSAATKSFEMAVNDPKTEMAARIALIQIALAEGQIEGARTQLKTLKKVHPKNLQVNYVEAVLAYYTKDYATTERIVEQLLRVAPESAQLLVLGGSANLQRGSLIAAEAKLGKVVQTVEGMPVARKMLAETYLRMGQPDKALSTLRPLLDQSQLDGDAHALAGHAYLQAGRPQDAEAQFLAAAKLKPDDVQVRTALALTDLVKGNSSAAFDALQDIAARDPGETADLALISAHMRRREFDSALRAIDALEKKKPAGTTADHLRGVALLGKGDRAGARVSFEKAVTVNPGQFVSVAALARIDVVEKKLAAARERLDAVVKREPKNIQARMLLLDLMIIEGLPHESLLLFIDQAIAVAPGEAAPRIAKIAQFSRTNNVKGAASAALDAMAAVPNNPEVLDAAGVALSRAGDDQQAMAAFNRMSAILPRSSVAYLRLADLYAKRGELNAVSQTLARAFDSNPGDPEVLRRLLHHATRTKDYRTVLSSARELQKRAPGSATGFILEGDAATAKKAWPEAVSAYRASLGKRDPEGRPPKLVYQALRNAGNGSGAEKFATDWLKSNPKEIVLREHLASEAIVRRDYQAAERLLRQVIDVDSSRPASLNNLAWVLAERADPASVQAAERAVALSPGSAPLLDTLAKALASQKEWDRAVQIQRQAVDLMPERAVYRLNLANIYSKAGRRAEALVEIEALAKLGDKFRFQAEVAELRKSLDR